MRKGAHAPGMDVAPILGLQINELRGIARIATVKFISGLVVSLSELESPLFYALKISANSCLTCCSWLARHPKMRKSWDASMASQSILALLKKEFAQPFPAQGLPGEKALQIPKKGRTISNRTRRFEVDVGARRRDPACLRQEDPK